MATLFTSLQVSLLVLLAALVALSAVAYAFAVGPARARLRTAYLVTNTVLIPLVAGVLALQLGARGRLGAEGLVPHPGLRQVVGVAAGIGARPTWMFTVSVEPDSVVAYYARPEARGGWTVLSEDAGLLVLGRDGERMTVAAGRDWNARTVTFAKAAAP